ncbi:response regulator [Bacteroidota bacterium]
MNILIVDDIVLNRYLLKELTKKMNVDIFEANNGREAIDIIQNNEINMVLMDIEMPVMNGIETTDYIRNELHLSESKLPVIAITAHINEYLGESLDTVGFNEIITKPYTPDQIINIISKNRDNR